MPALLLVLLRQWRHCYYDVTQSPLHWVIMSTDRRKSNENITSASVHYVHLGGDNKYLETKCKKNHVFYSCKSRHKNHCTKLSTAACDHGLCDGNKLLYKRYAKSMRKPKIRPPQLPHFLTDFNETQNQERYPGYDPMCKIWLMWDDKKRVCVGRTFTVTFCVLSFFVAYFCLRLQVTPENDHDRLWLKTRVSAYSRAFLGSR